MPATPAPTPLVTAPPATSAAGDGTWLVMLYQNADDEVLEQDIVTDLNEAELVGSTDRVTIVAQLDRYDGAFDGDGDWTGSRRFLVEQDDDLRTLASEEIEDLGEVDSGDWQTLSDFATWAIESFPADHYALILSDHGAGWVGGWNDNAPTEGSAFTTDDIDRALRDTLERTGVDRLDLLGFDACLMSQVEALAAVTPYAARRGGVGRSGAGARLGVRRLPRRARRRTPTWGPRTWAGRSSRATSAATRGSPTTTNGRASCSSTSARAST